MSKEIICGIYKITSPSGRVYIGKSKNLESRLRDYKKSIERTKPQRLLYKSFKKYGVEEHNFEIIEECPIIELYCRERYWQDFYNVLNGGLNCILTACEDHPAEMSEETRRKKSESLKGENNPMYGLKGENHPAFGFKMNEEQLEKHKKRMNDRITPEVLKQMSERVKGDKNPMYGVNKKGELNPMYGVKGECNKRSIIHINLETGIFYFSLEEVANSFSHITKCMMRNMLSGRDFNKTPIVRVDDYLNGIAKYNESKPLKKVVNTKTGVVYNSVTIVSERYGIDKARLRNMLGGSSKNKSDFEYLENYNFDIVDKKYVLDLSTGIYYNSIVEASKYSGIDYITLRKILLNDSINKTSLIYV